jgi:hypothetical protein
MTGARRLWLTTLGALVAGLTLAGSAHAAITGSTITTPTDLSFFVADSDAGSSTVDISGSTSGGSPSDKVDVRCYYGASGSFLVRSNVSLNVDGTFSTIAGLGGIDHSVCILRAIPASSFPSDLTPFSGPRVGTGERQTYTIAGGPNAGHAYDFHMWAQQLTAAFDYHSLTRCGLYDGFLFDAALNLTTITFKCNAWFDISNAPAATRSGLQIDGANAYGAYSAQDINSVAAAGLPAVSYSFTSDPATGNMVIHETEPLVKCADATYPPTLTTCPTFVSTGVTDTRTISQDHDGHLSTITDVFSSTDGAAHSLDLLWENDQAFQLPGFGDATKIAFQFPGQSGFSTHGAGDAVSLPGTPGTILIHVAGAADGDPTTGQGAIVYDRPADSATFIYGDTFVDEFNLHQTGTVPAGGSTTYRFAYAQGYTAAGVAALAQSAAESFAPPTPTPTPTPTPKPTPTPTPPKPSCKVPKLKGKTLNAAKKALKKAHCAAGKTSRKRSKTVRKGRVISTKPKAGKKLANGAKVKLTLSKGG